MMRRGGCAVRVQCVRSAGGSERARCVSHSLWFLLRLRSGAAPPGELYITVTCAHGAVSGCGGAAVAPLEGAS